MRPAWSVGVLTLGLAVGIAACALGPHATNEANFTKAINAHLALNPADVDVPGMGFGEGFVHENDADSMSRVRALVSVGLLKSSGSDTDASTGARDFNYLVTPLGKQLLASMWRDHFAYADEQVDRISDWTGGSGQQARVQYTYRIAKIYDWANQPNVRAAFPEIGDEIANQGKQQRNIDLWPTHAGWSADPPR